MPAINYLSELDRINAKKALGPIIKDMSERELKVALLYILHGIDIYEAVESARVTQKSKICPHGIKKVEEKLHFAGAIFVCECCGNTHGTFNMPLPKLCSSCM